MKIQEQPAVRKLYIPLEVKVLTFSAEEGFANSTTGDAGHYGTDASTQENAYQIIDANSNSGVWQ